MEIVNVFRVGTYFNKDNIVLATIVDPSEITYDFFIKKFDKDIPTEYKKTLSTMIDNGGISTEDYDIFYMDNNGYNRYNLENGIDTIIGDNSDGKGLIINVVSAWEYFDDDDIVEGLLDDSTRILCIKNIKSLEHYNFDYNINMKNRHK